MLHKTYLADMGMITSVGKTAASVFHCVRAGISRHGYSNYSTDDHYDIKLNLVPNSALPPLAELLEMAEALSFRDERLLLMSQVAATEATSRYDGAPIPLILSAPENYHGINNQISQHFSAR